MVFLSIEAHAKVCGCTANWNGRWFCNTQPRCHQGCRDSGQWFPDRKSCLKRSVVAAEPPNTPSVSSESKVARVPELKNTAKPKTESSAATAPLKKRTAKKQEVTSVERQPAIRPQLTEKAKRAAQGESEPNLRTANLLLKKVDAYAKSSSSITNIVGIAESASKLKSAIKLAESRPMDQTLGERVEKLTAELAQVLAKDASYATFESEWDEAKKKSDADVAAKLRVKADELRNFLVRYVSQDVMSDTNAILFPQIRALEGLGSDTTREQLETAVGNAEAAISSAGLDSEYNETGLSDAGATEAVFAPKQASVATADETAIRTQKRVALVIGNSAYRNAVELPNPRNDARAITAQLVGLGFEVIGREDLDKDGMERSIREFIGKVDGAEVSLFFYAGHGIQVSGKNYLIPTDARLDDVTAIDFETIDADRVLGYMAEENRVAIAFLDACRDNPFTRRFARKLGASRSVAVGRGLAIPSVLGDGMLIGFATSPGDVALDGQGANSPFTAALLKYIPQRGLEIQQLMTKVKAEVYQTTHNRQSPWHNSNLRTEFYIRPN